MGRVSTVSTQSNGSFLCVVLLLIASGAVQLNYLEANTLQIISPSTHSRHQWLATLGASASDRGKNNNNNNTLRVEYVINLPNGNTTPNSIRHPQTHTCVKVTPTSHNQFNKNGSFSHEQCVLAGEPRSSGLNGVIEFRGLPPGEFDIVAWNIQHDDLRMVAGYAMLASEATRRSFKQQGTCGSYQRVTGVNLVNKANYFDPSYEWQRVEAWQQIPPGLEVRLNLHSQSSDVENTKEATQQADKLARIPSPWKLKLNVYSDVSAVFGPEETTINTHMNTKDNDKVNDIESNNSVNSPRYLLVGSTDIEIYPTTTISAMLTVVGTHFNQPAQCIQLVIGDLWFGLPQSTKSKSVIGQLSQEAFLHDLLVSSATAVDLQLFDRNLDREVWLLIDEISDECECTAPKQCVYTQRALTYCGQHQLEQSRDHSADDSNNNTHSNGDSREDTISSASNKCEQALLDHDACANRCSAGLASTRGPFAGSITPRNTMKKASTLQTETSNIPNVELMTNIPDIETSSPVAKQTTNLHIDPNTPTTDDMSNSIAEETKSAADLGMNEIAGATELAPWQPMSSELNCQSVLSVPSESTFCVCRYCAYNHSSGEFIVFTKEPLIVPLEGQSDTTDTVILGTSRHAAHFSKGSNTNGVIQGRLVHVVDDSGDGDIDGSRSICSSYVQEPVFVASVWSLFNVYHLIADLLQPLYPIVEEARESFLTPGSPHLILDLGRIEERAKLTQMLNLAYDGSWFYPLSLLSLLFTRETVRSLASLQYSAIGVTCLREVHIGVNTTHTPAQYAFWGAPNHSILPDIGLERFNTAAAPPPPPQSNEIDYNIISNNINRQHISLASTIFESQTRFSQFVRDKTGMTANNQKVDKAKFNVVFVNRRGSRRFENLSALKKSTRALMSSSGVNGNVKDVVLERLPFQKQLRTFSNTNILVCVSGQGCANTALLAPGSALVLIMPSGWQGWQWMYTNMARASNVRTFVVKRFNNDGQEVEASEGWGGTDDDYLGSNRASGEHPIRDKTAPINPEAFDQAMQSALEAVALWRLQHGD